MTKSISIKAMLGLSATLIINFGCTGGGSNPVPPPPKLEVTCADSVSEADCKRGKDNLAVALKNVPTDRDFDKIQIYDYNLGTINGVVSVGYDDSVDEMSAHLTNQYKKGSTEAIGKNKWNLASDRIKEKTKFNIICGDGFSYAECADAEERLLSLLPKIPDISPSFISSTLVYLNTTEKDSYPHFPDMDLDLNKSDEELLALYPPPEEIYQKSIRTTYIDVKNLKTSAELEEALRKNSVFVHCQYGLTKEECMTGLRNLAYISQQIPRNRVFKSFRISDREVSTDVNQFVTLHWNSGATRMLEFLRSEPLLNSATDKDIRAYQDLIEKLRTTNNIAIRGEGGLPINQTKKYIDSIFISLEDLRFRNKKAPKEISIYLLGDQEQRLSHSNIDNGHSFFLNPDLTQIEVDELVRQAYQ